MVYSVPAVITTTSSGSTVGSTPNQGLVVAAVGTAPLGPAAPRLVASKEEAASVFGSDFLYSDLQGWTLPKAIRSIYDNAIDAQPLVLVCRSGTVQATALLPDAVGSTGVWNATVLTKALGGTSGNGTTVQYTSPNIIITPPVASGLATETFSVGASATWQTIATIVNARSQLISIALTGVDGPANADVTLTALTGGNDGNHSGAGPTASDINAVIDALANTLFSQQPINVLLPTFSDSVAGTVAAHALAAVVAWLTTNGQRCQVIASAINPTSIADMQSLATTLNGGLESGGDSGRATLIGSYAPYAIDPATGNERLYPAWVTAAAYAGLVASLPPAAPRGRRKLLGFTRFGEGFTITQRTTLLGSGVLVVRPDGRLIDQVTCANLSSYRRSNSIATAEDVWVADLQDLLDRTVIEQQAGPNAGVFIDNLCVAQMLSYREQGLLAAAKVAVTQSTVDARNWAVNVQYVPIFDVRQILLFVQLVTGTNVQAAVLTSF